MIVDKPICSRTGNSCYEFDNRVTQMQKNLLVYLGGSRHQLAVLNPFGSNQLAGDLVHFVAAAPDDNDLQTIVLVQMNVQAGIHCHMSLMLHVCQEIAQVVYPMVIDQSNDPDDFGICQSY